VSVGTSTQTNGIFVVGNDGAWWAHAEGLPHPCKAIKLGSDVELTAAACERAAKMKVTLGAKKECIDLSYGAHAMGSCRMGQEVKNLLICGTRAFITGSGLNPTRTAMEVASRSAELAHGLLPADEGDAGAPAVHRVPVIAERMQRSPYGQVNVSNTEVDSKSSNNMIADVGTTWVSSTTLAHGAASSKATLAVEKAPAASPSSRRSNPSSSTAPESQPTTSAVIPTKAQPPVFLNSKPKPSRHEKDCPRPWLLPGRYIPGLRHHH
jgi:hypothetical protein